MSPTAEVNMSLARSRVHDPRPTAWMSTLRGKINMVNDEGIKIFVGVQQELKNG